jgi:hypothetical protein
LCIAQREAASRENSELQTRLQRLSEQLARVAQDALQADSVVRCCYTSHPHCSVLTCTLLLLC